jgi:hypothetical protein
MLANNENFAARVDYQTCNLCGFRLMRVESTRIDGQSIIENHCPICELCKACNSGHFERSQVIRDRIQYFDTWLELYGLDQKSLEFHYHLSPEHFFEGE